MRIEVNGETAYCHTNSRDIEADKPTVVFIHGSGMDHTVWTKLNSTCIDFEVFRRHNQNEFNINYRNRLQKQYH